MAKYGAFKYGSTITYGFSADPPPGPVNWKILIDWDGDGTFSGAGEGAYLTDLRIERGKRHVVRSNGGGFEQMDTGTAELTLENVDQRYNPYNASSPLYPNVLPGRRAQVALMYYPPVGDPQTKILFTGWVGDIQPEPDRETVKITCYDGWQYCNQQIKLDLAALNYSLELAIRLVLYQAGYPSYAPWQIMPDSQPVRVLSFRDINAASCIKDIADAGLGNIFFDRNGAPTFYPRSYNSQATHTLDQAQVHREIYVSQPWDMIRNAVTVVAHRVVKKATSTVWSLTDPIFLGGGQSANMVASFDPAVDLWPGETKAFSIINGSGADLSSKFKVVWTALGTISGKFTVTNTGVADGYLTQAALYGRTLADVPTDYDVEATTAERAAYGLRSFKLDTKYLQSRNYASAFATIIKDFLKTPRKRLVVRVEQRPDLQYDCELMDKVAFTSTTLSIDTSLYVLGIEHKWRKATGQAVDTRMYLGEMIYDTTSITAEPPGEEAEIPEEPPEDPPVDPPPGDGGGDPEDPPTDLTAVAAATTGSAVYVSPNFGATTPTWTSKGFSGSLIDFDTPPRAPSLGFAATEDAVYVCTDLRKVGTSSWASRFAASEFGTGGTIVRVRAIPTETGGAVALGWADSASTGYADVFVAITHDGGANWTTHLVREAGATKTEYTVTTGSGESYTNTDLNMVHPRVGDEGNTLNPWALAVRNDYYDGAGGAWISMYTGANTIHGWSAGNMEQFTVGIAAARINDGLDTPQRATAAGWLNEYFGVGGWGQFQSYLYGSMPLDAARTIVNINIYHSNGARNNIWSSYVFWNKPSVVGLSALDVAPTNGSMIYVGFDDAIYKTDNGGTSWYAATETYGATDICVDPQLAGLIYFRDTNGYVRTLAGSTPGSFLSGFSTPNTLPIHIARSPNSGKLYVVENGAIKIRELGSVSAPSGWAAASGRSLRAYLGAGGDRVVYMAGAPYYSAAAATPTSKAGSTSFSGGLTIHLLE